MVSELVFIKLFLTRMNYSRYRSFLKANDLPKEVTTLLNGLDTFYHSNEDVDCTLEELYFILLPKGNKSELGHIFRTLKAIDVPSTAIEALKQYKQKQMLENLSIIAYDASNGNADALTRLSEAYADIEYADVDVEEDLFTDWDLDRLTDSVDRSKGLKWRLKVFRDYLGNLIPGDFGFFVARPETGKTTMLASEITHMAEHLREDQGPLIWFNNEEKNDKVQIRIYQAAFGISMEELLENKEHYKERFDKEFSSKIRMVRNQHISKADVENTVGSAKPSLIILDQIDPIHGFKGDREDLRLGAIYKWARQLAIKNDCAVLGVSQASNEAEGKDFLYMNHVSNAKTEKQATADFIVGIGKKHEFAYERLRYLHFMKNKLTGLHTKHEVLIDADTARYKDL